MKGEKTSLVAYAHCRQLSRGVCVYGRVTVVTVDPYIVYSTVTPV